MKFFNLTTFFILALLVITTEATTGREVVEYAKQFIGVPYVYGGNGPNEFDCSGFTKYVYKNFGYNLPRNSAQQAKYGKAVSTSDLQLGDLVCYPGHVAIYVGDGKVIHAPTENDKVKIASINMGKNQPITTCRIIVDGGSGGSSGSSSSGSSSSGGSKRWLPPVDGYSKSDANNGYAGIMGRAMTGLRINGGDAYRVHIKGGKWLPAVTGNNIHDGDNGYAGTIKGSIIDAVAISGGVQYAVHIKGGQWLPAVDEYDISDAEYGYAGIIGKPIDAIMIKGRAYASSYNA